MKKLFYRKVYNILLFLSHRFNNPHILKYKIWAGSAILALTSSCQSPKNNTKEIQATISTDSIKEEQNPDVDILCYEPAAIPLDSTPEPSAKETELAVMCYDIQEYDIEPDTIPKAPNHIYDLVDEMPKFRGGNDSLFFYIKRNLEYPSILADSHIEGRVIVRFVVEKDGSISSPQILRSIHELLDKEALRVINEMPKWQPGIQRGEPVRVYYTIPVRF